MSQGYRRRLIPKINCRRSRDLGTHPSPLSLAILSAAASPPIHCLFWQLTLTLILLLNLGAYLLPLTEVVCTHRSVSQLYPCDQSSPTTSLLNSSSLYYLARSSLLGITISSKMTKNMTLSHLSSHLHSLTENSLLEECPLCTVQGSMEGSTTTTLISRIES